MQDTGVIIISTVLIILALLILSLRNSLNSFEKKTLVVKDNLAEIARKRLDLAPFLIEVVRKHVTGKEILLKKLIQLREENSQQKLTIERERKFTEMIEDILALRKKYPVLKKEIHFLEAKKWMRDLEKEWEEGLKKYWHC